MYFVISKSLLTFVIQLTLNRLMNLTMQYDVTSRENPYFCPMAVVLFVETEEAFAKSNTEQIIEDDDEYGWGD